MVAKYVCIYVPMYVQSYGCTAHLRQLNKTNKQLRGFPNKVWNHHVMSDICSCTICAQWSIYMTDVVASQHVSHQLPSLPLKHLIHITSLLNANKPPCQTKTSNRFRFVNSGQLENLQWSGTSTSQCFRDLYQNTSFKQPERIGLNISWSPVSLQVVAQLQTQGANHSVFFHIPMSNIDVIIRYKGNVVPGTTTKKAKT